MKLELTNEEVQIVLGALDNLPVRGEKALTAVLGLISRIKRTAMEEQNEHLKKSANDGSASPPAD